jgi:hypothetical protein
MSATAFTWDASRVYTDIMIYILKTKIKHKLPNKISFHLGQKKKKKSRSDRKGFFPIRKKKKIDVIPSFFIIIIIFMNV